MIYRTVYLSWERKERKTILCSISLLVWNVNLTTLWYNAWECSVSSKKWFYVFLPILFALTQTIWTCRIVYSTTASESSEAGYRIFFVLPSVSPRVGLARALQTLGPLLDVLFDVQIKILNLSIYNQPLTSIVYRIWTVHHQAHWTRAPSHQRPPRWTIWLVRIMLENDNEQLSSLDRANGSCWIVIWMTTLMSRSQCQNEKFSSENKDLT